MGKWRRKEEKKHRPYKAAHYVPSKKNQEKKYTGKYLTSKTSEYVPGLQDVKNRVAPLGILRYNI